MLDVIIRLTVAYLHIQRIWGDTNTSLELCVSQPQCQSNIHSPSLSFFGLQKVLALWLLRFGFPLL